MGWGRVSLETPRFCSLNIQLTLDLHKLSSLFHLLASPVAPAPYSHCSFKNSYLVNALFYRAALQNDFCIHIVEASKSISWPPRLQGLSLHPLQPPPPTATPRTHPSVLEIFSSDTWLSKHSLRPGSLIQFLAHHLFWTLTSPLILSLFQRPVLSTHPSLFNLDPTSQHSDHLPQLSLPYYLFSVFTG